MATTVKSGKKAGAALILGGGIGGMQAALDFAAAGIKVYLADAGPCIGGVMAQLDKTFPTNDCAMCTMAPRLVEISRHKDIELLMLSEVVRVEGEAGDMKVTLKRRPRYVDEDKCTGCGLCVMACPLSKVKPTGDPKKPQPIPDEFNQGLSNRSAIYIPFPQAIPNIALIDAANCLRLKGGKCMSCQKVCQAAAIDFNQVEKEVTLNVGAVIAAPGYELFDAKLKPDYGYGRFPNVVTSIEYERILSASGPYSGHVLRPSDKTVPKRIAFIQCVGSRDNERDYCSSVCCMYATKEALLTKEHAGADIQCDIFFMDLRAFSKGFEEYYNRAKAQGIQYIRCRPPQVKEVPQTKNLRIDFLTEDEKKSSAEYDLVVLSVGIGPPEDSKGLADKLGLKLNEHGFCSTSVFEPLDTPNKGVWAAGVFTSPKDIPETVIQASASVARALENLSEAKGTMLAKEEFPPEIAVEGQDPRVGVFVCHCGTNIASVVNVAQTAEYAKSLPGVVHAENVLYACANDSQEKIKKAIVEHKLNRVVVAACTPRTHEPLFRNTVREAGLNPYLFEMANIRDQNSWVHMHHPEQATRVAKDLVRMAVAKARLLEPLYRKRIPIEKDVLVIGGGLAGMTSAVSLANQGYQVHLVEKEAELGGNLRHTHYLLDASADPQKHLKDLIAKVKGHSKIKVYPRSKIAAIEGFTGNFKTRVAQDGKELEFRHGAIVVATGAKEFKPTEYLYGQNPGVLTQRELEERLASGAANLPDTVVMIQCVGSRDKERPYCSRICCGLAVKNALKIKEKSPHTSVYVLFRDVRTYGFNEKYYSQARQAGVVFCRYHEDHKPEVTASGAGLQVEFFEPITRERVRIDAGMVALSAATVPLEENKEMGSMLKVPLDPNGYFLEAHMKLRPVDFATDGIFLCGLAHYPKTVDETIAQAGAASARVAALLAKDTMELEANISKVMDANCDGCAYCVDPCPYKAITLLEFARDGAVKKIVEINESVCKGCGVCQATCPKKGVAVQGFRLDQFAAMVEAALAPVPEGEKTEVGS